MDGERPKALEAATLAGTLVAILAYGGTHAAAVGAACLFLGLGLTSWFATTRKLAAPLAVWVPLLAGAFGLLQLIPVPHLVLGLLSPETTGIRSFATAATWGPVSYAPGETALAVARSALVGLAALVGAALVDRNSIAVPVRVVLVAGGAVFAVIIGHAVVGAGAIYGLKEAVGRGFSAPLGPFVNANHLAAFLVLLTPVAAGAAWGSERRVPRLAAATLALAGAAALVATFSRGGMVALVAATVVFALGVRVVADNPRMAVVPLGGGFVAALLGVAWTGGHVLFLFNRDLLLAPRGKGPIWEAGLAMLSAHPWLGIGRGAFGAVYTRYGLPHGAVQSAHVENSYLAMLLDFGLPVGLLILAGAALVARSALRSAPDPLRVGAWAGLAGLAVHNLVDYNIELPGVAVPAALLLGALCGSEVRERGAAPSHPLLRGVDLEGRGAGLLLASLGAVAGLGLLLGAGGSVEQIDARRDALLSERPVSPDAEAAAVALAEQRPGDPWSWLPLGEALLDSRPAEALSYVNRAMVLDPRSPRPHQIASTALLKLGRRGQAAGEARRALEKAAPEELEPLLRSALKIWTDPPDLERIMPRSSRAAERSVAFFRGEGRHGDAVRAARAWMASADAGPWASVTLAELLSERNLPADDFEARMLAFDALSRTAGYELDRALLVYGRVQLRRGRVGWAELVDAIEKIPRTADSRIGARAAYFQGRVAEAEGRLVEALERAETASGLMPDAPEYRGELARMRRVVAEAGVAP